MKFNPSSLSARLLVLACVASFGLATPVAGWSAPEAQQSKPAATYISGTVVDSEGEPAIGASVKCKDGSVLPVVTDIDGRFTIKASKPVTLEISYIGYKPEIVKARPGVAVNVKLQMGENVLDDVVVVGFATQKKINLTGSVGVASSKELAGRPVQSTTQALQGVIPGLNISNGGGGGALDATKSINVRGTTTISGTSSGSPLVLIDGMEGDINTLNPNDIENISVLKDAAASSIYGSRAPFGVILITTKRGEEGTAQIHYNNSFRFNEPLNLMRAMDTREYIHYLNDVHMYTHNSPEFSDDFVNGAMDYYYGRSENYIFENKWQGTIRRWGSGECGGTYANVDWVNEIYKKQAFAQEHNLTLSGGNKQTQYYVSGNFLEQGGFLKYGNDNYDRYQIMGRFSSQMTKWLNIQYTGRWIRTEYDRPYYLSGGFFEKMIRRVPPTNPVYDPNGYIAGDYNYIEHLSNGGRYQTQNDQFTNQVKFVITPLKDWNIVSELNARVYNDWTHQFSRVVYAHNADDLPGLSSETTHEAFDSGLHDHVSEWTRRTTYLNANIYTDYSFNIAEKNNFKTMLGFQNEDNLYRELSANRQDMLNPDMPLIDLTTSETAGTYGMSGNLHKWRTVGFFGRINYDYDSRYLAEFNLRYDGSSRFRSYHRWVWSPSASLGWNVDREAFWESIRSTVNGLKLRASYGQLANQNTWGWYPTYLKMGVHNQGSNWLVNNGLPTTSGYAGVVNPQLTWEKIITTNLGLDFSAFRYRLTGSFDYFWRTNKDMMGPARKWPATLGYGAPDENILELCTSGWELQLGWQDNINGFTYSAKLNLSDDRCKIIKYPNPERLLTKYIAGEYLGNIYGYESLGIAQTKQEMDDHLSKVNQDALGSDWQAGDMMYKDLDGNDKIEDPTSLNDLKDKKLIGNDAPRYRVGLNLYAAWKGFDVTCFLQGVLKRDYYFSPYGGQGTGGKGAVFWGATVGGRWESIFLKDHLDYWRDENSALGANPDAYYARPLYYTNKNREFQDRFVQDASYVRIKNLQLGYTLPKKYSQKFFCNNLRVYFSAENLATFTNMSKVIDVESLEVSAMKSGSAYPLAKTYSFGLTVDF